jgi:signal transduction histidine kinase
MRIPLNHCVRVITALWFFFITICGSAQTPYVLDASSSTHRLDALVQVFIDSTNTVSAERVVHDDFQAHFRRSKGNLTFGYLTSTIWLKVVTKNATPRHDWYLEIPAPFLEYVDFYQLLDGDSVHYAKAGYFRRQSEKEISHTGHVLPLQFRSDGTSTVFVRITGSSPKTFPLLVVEKESFYEKVRFEDLGYGVFFGILFVMFFYNLFIYLTLNQTNYLLYICTIICTFLIFASATGYAGRFLWPETPVLNYYAGRLTLGLLSAVLAIFTIRFLEVRLYSKVMYYTLLSLIPLGFIAVILMATKTMSSAGNNLISLSTIVYMTTGVVCSMRGNKTGYYFIAAWTIYFFGGLLLTLRNSGVFDFNFWTTHFVEIGAALETIIIAIALGDRYRRYQQEIEEVQLLALKVQQEANERLEGKVSERTVQLSSAYEELRSTLETNKQQTEIIENKNAELDAFFYRISHDLRGPVSSLLGLSFLAKREVKDRQALEYLERQHAQIERLSNIITGLINLTKLNRTDLQKEPIDFNKIVDECVASFHGLPNFAGLHFKKEIQSDIQFHSEWTLINAIVQNLVENAIKYANQQSPYVNVKISADPKELVIAVADNGEGIAEEHQEKVFEMFYRATQNASGTGLGLYILKRSVDRLKGTIEIKSEVGNGSVFTIRLPLVTE